MMDNDKIHARVEGDKIALGPMSSSKGDADDVDGPEIYYLTGIRFHLIVAAYVLNTLPQSHSHSTQSIQHKRHVTSPHRIHRMQV